MTRKFLNLITIIILITVSTFSLTKISSVNKPTGGRMKNTIEIQELWTRVEKATNDGLPRTAIENLDKIIELSSQIEDYNNFLKAFSQRIVFESTIEGNKAQDKVILLKKYMEGADSSLKPVLKAILAKWYWHFFDSARWRFSQRTETVSLDDDDIMTWDLKKILGEIDSLYTDILKEKELLSKIPTSIFSDFFTTPSFGKELRPTLYDFMVMEAVTFYTQAENHIIKPTDAFEIDFDAVCISTKDFVNYKPDTTDKESPKYKVIKLYQELINLHIAEKNMAALADTELSRLVYLKNNSFGENKNIKFIERLEETLKISDNQYVNSAIYYNVAKAWQDEEELEKAVEIADKGYKLYSRTPGGKSCLNLMQEITASRFNLSINRLYGEKEKKEISIKYRNTPKLYFRIYAQKWDEFLQDRNVYPYYFDTQKIPSIISQKPYREWEITLPATSDYKEKQEIITFPEIENGFYRIFTSSDKNFPQNKISHDWFWVSNLGIITRNDPDMISCFVVDNNTGKPVANAEVTVYARKNTGFTKFAGGKTDKDGFFKTKSDTILRRDYYNFIIHAKASGQELLDISYSYPSSPSRDERSYNTVMLMTDRALYRPGQTVRFKGIAIKVDRAVDNYEVVKNAKVKLTFYDTNRQIIDSLDVVSNDFGSFSGNFTAPSDRLTGQMSIVSSISGQTTFRVEEYKRPKFYVTVNNPEKDYVLDEIVEIKGKALSYSGAPVNGAIVKFRVKREAIYPFWYWWFYPPTPTGESREIDFGTVYTDDSGNFTIKFKAAPDRKISIDSDPSFNYTVYAEVTDMTGETRSSSTSVKIGYKAFNIEFESSEKIYADKEFKLNLSAVTLNGMQIEAIGEYEIWKLREPVNPVREELTYRWFRKSAGNLFSGDDFGPDWKTWPQDKKVLSGKFNISKDKKFIIDSRLKSGFYRVVTRAKDNNGKVIENFHPIMVLNGRDSKKFELKIPYYVDFEKTSVEVGQNFDMVWGTGYQSGMAYIEIIHRGKTLRSFWTESADTQKRILMPVTSEMRGGFGVHVTYVRENRPYINKYHISVPHTNKKLNVTFSSFRDKLYPGEKEKWVVNIKPQTGQIDGAELAAVLYDSSLDAFYAHNWNKIEVFRSHYLGLNSRYSNEKSSFSGYSGDYYGSHGGSLLTYWSFPDHILYQLGYYDFYSAPSGMGGMLMDSTVRRSSVKSFSKQAMDSNMVESAMPAMEAMSDVVSEKEEEMAVEDNTESPKDINIRTNLNETAFFYPHLLMNKDGSVSFEFTMPEALTKWKFMGLAHGKLAESGLLEAYTVTQKELMVEPNPPRFLREKDIIEFTAKISNLSEKKLNIETGIQFIELFTEKKVNNELKIKNINQKISLEAGLSQTVSWKLEVPYDLKTVKYEVWAKADNYSDGEAGVIPVLSSRMLVKESLPLWVTGPGQQKFDFKNISKILGSDTATPVHFSVEMTSNPSWYAIQALPYLMEYPYECAEQIFNRYYANLLAGSIANSNPRIREVFDMWKNEYQDQLKSPLEKNEELKTALLKETPWVIDSQNEKAQKARIGLLFDKNNLINGIDRAYTKLKQMQRSDGAWPWFPGGPADDYITLYIMTGFGRLRHLGVDGDNYAALRAVTYMDGWIKRVYDELRDKNRNNLSSTIALYLYGRSFYNDIKPVPAQSKQAVDYFLKQSAEYWLRLNSRQSQGHLALALNRFNDKTTASKIMASIYERSVYDEEMGRYWREDELSFFWYRAPVETQALMIEAFDEVSSDEKAVDECKRWLLKQKQTQNWKTTKATADAVYALILRGDNYLSNDEIVELRIGNKKVEPEKIEPGVNYYKKNFTPDEIKKEFSNISVSRKTKGISWGGAYFQYVEDISKIPYHKTSLSLEKSLWVTKFTKSGPVIEKVTGDLNPGDQIKVRIVLRTDRDLEYVHLKDHRGSGMEPENVLSTWKYQDGLGYYEATGDTATNFFISYLPKGTYVFEYAVRIQHRGRYETGFASIQCMYAPEFSSHSQSVPVSVK